MRKAAILLAIFIPLIAARAFAPSPTVVVTNRSLSPAHAVFESAGGSFRMGAVYPGQSECLRLPEHVRGVIAMYSASRRLLTFSPSLDTNDFDGAWTWEYSESDLRRPPPQGLLMSVRRRCSRYKA